jgi:hypothetical protein
MFFIFSHAEIRTQSTHFGEKIKRIDKGVLYQCCFWMLAYNGFTTDLNLSVIRQTLLDRLRIILREIS